MTFMREGFRDLIAIIKALTYNILPLSPIFFLRLTISHTRASIPTPATLATYETPSAQVTLTISWREILEATITSTALFMFLLMPRVLIQSLPEPIGITPKVKSENCTPFDSEKRRIALSTSCTVPSPPTAIKRLTPLLQASSVIVRTLPAAPESE